MATHSSVPAWRIPGTGEPGGLPSMESHSRTRLKQQQQQQVTTVMMKTKQEGRNEGPLTY